MINSVRSKGRLFTGNIISIKNEPNNQVLISLVSGVELNETGITSLTVIRVPHQEQFYSMARLSGWPQDHLNIHGLDDSEKEILAIVPFKGLLIEKEEMIGEVQFTNLKSIQEMLPRSEESEKWKGLLDADGWIVFRLKAAHFAEAEAAAIEKADVFLSAYSGLLKYGYSQFDGDFIEWERAREWINIQRQSHILLIRGKSSERVIDRKVENMERRRHL